VLKVNQVLLWFLATATLNWILVKLSKLTCCRAIFISLCFRLNHRLFGLCSAWSTGAVCFLPVCSSSEYEGGSLTQLAIAIPLDASCNVSYNTAQR
jgi:hypothetical protein